jgi:hypothetical protein
MNPGLEEYLFGIDIPDPCNPMLIEEENFIPLFEFRISFVISKTRDRQGVRPEPFPAAREDISLRMVSISGSPDIMSARIPKE